MQVEIYDPDNPVEYKLTKRLQEAVDRCQQTYTFFKGPMKVIGLSFRGRWDSDSVFLGQTLILELDIDK